MAINERTIRLRNVLGDFLMANLSWLLLNIYRYQEIAYRSFADLDDFLSSPLELKLQLIIPLFSLAVYYYSGYYNNPMHKSRLGEFKTTFTSVMIITLCVFFAAILNDEPNRSSVFYKLILILFFLQFVLTYGLRFAMTQSLMRKVHRRTFGFNTVIVGAGKRGVALKKELDNLPEGTGSIVVGFVDSGREACIAPEASVLGKLDDFEAVVREYGIREIIVAPDSHDERKLFELLNKLYKFGLPIQVVAGRYSILSRAVKMSGVFSSPMIQVTRDNMTESQKNIKHTIDFVCSLAALAVLSPLFAYLAYRIKKDSPGSVFYRQERIGYKGKPFTIVKFRTMTLDAEKEGTPLLSSRTDNRITPFGHLMRKYRLDELPQFWNILKGEMSLVGPRPERKYFVDKIVEKAPYYCLIYDMKPGLTSWATVKNGYTDTLDKMIDRLKYDIIYLESRSLAVDFKILFYTVKTIFAGQGM